jgi:hypothetical protein
MLIITSTLRRSVVVVVVRVHRCVETISSEMRARLETLVVAALENEILVFAAETVATHKVLEAGAELGVRPGVDERIDEGARDGEHVTHEKDVAEIFRAFD